MPIVSCDQCGKKLNAKDEWLGRKLKCPGCGSTFTASVGAAASAPAAPVSRGPAKPAPATATERAKARSGPAERYKGGGLSINWGLMALLAGVLVVVAGILWVVFGPVANNRAWNARYEAARGEVTDVVHAALQNYVDKNTIEMEGRPPPTAGVNDVAFQFDSFRWSMPRTVDFTGASTQGIFSGTYDLQTGEVVASVEVGGSAIAAQINMIPGQGPTGPEAALVGKAGAGEKLQVRGKSPQGGPLEVEVDGQKIR